MSQRFFWVVAVGCGWLRLAAVFWVGGVRLEWVSNAGERDALPAHLAQHVARYFAVLAGSDASVLAD